MNQLGGANGGGRNARLAEWWRASQQPPDFRLRTASAGLAVA